MEKKKRRERISPPRKRKKKKKIYRTGRLRINIVAGVTNSLAILICAVFIYNFFMSQFTLSEILLLVFVLFFTETLIVNIFALYATKTNRLPFIGQSAGILASVLMLGYPSLGAFPATILYIVATVLVLKKRRYLVSPKRRKKPFYKNPLLLAALLVSLLFGGFQAYAAVQTKEPTPKPSKVKTTNSSTSSSQSQVSSESTTSTETSESESEESTAPSESSTTQETESKPVNLGTKVDGLVIKVDRLEEKNELGQGDNKYTAAEETKYVLIYITVHNEANEDRVFSSNNFLFVADGGEEYSIAPIIEIDPPSR